MGGAIPLLTPTCLHGVDRENFTFTDNSCDPATTKYMQKVFYRKAVDLNNKKNLERVRKIIMSCMKVFHFHDLFAVGHCAVTWAVSYPPNTRLQYDEESTHCVEEEPSAV
jgi:hypothetical protein